MKIRIFLFALLLTPFCLLLGSMVLLQSAGGKERIKQKIIEEARKNGVVLSIDRIEGRLPLDWRLQGVEIRRANLPRLQIDSLQVRLSPLPLLKKQLSIEYLKVEGGKVQDTRFTAKGRLRIDLEQKKPLKIHHLLIEGDDLYVRLEGKVQTDWTIQEGYLSFFLPDASLFTHYAQGNIEGRAEVTKTAGNCVIHTGELEVAGYPCTKSTLHIAGKKVKESWEGNCNMVWGHIDLPLTTTLSYRYSPQKKILQIDNCSVTGSALELEGNFFIDAGKKNLSGDLEMHFQDLKTMRPLFPDSYLKGSLQAKVELASLAGLHDLSMQLDLENFGAFDVACQNFYLESTLSDIFGDSFGNVFLSCDNLTHKQTEVASLEFSSQVSPLSSPFFLTLAGKMGDPYQLEASGTWQKRGKGLYSNIQQLDGIAFKKPFSLCEAFTLEYSSDHFKMSNCALDIADGHIFSRIDLTKSSSLIKVRGESFPLEYIPFRSPYFSLEGSSDFQIDLVSWESNIQGSCNIALKRAWLHSDGKTTPLITKGSLQVSLSQNIAQLHGELKAEGEQFFHFFGSLPITYQHFPFQIQVDPKKAITGELLAEGSLQEIFHFINIGAHRVEGWLSAHLYLSKTLEKPALQGWLELQDGLYENFYTGTHLQNITAKARAQKQTIKIASLTATDDDEGTVTAEGEIQLKELFPFTLTAHLDQMDTVSFDLISGKFSGDITISGDKTGALASGSLDVTEATMQIPDQLPTALPELPISFIHPPEHIQRAKDPAPPSSPLRLDLDIEAPGNIFVEGRGLHSELEGKLHLSGNYVDIAASGTLQLKRGEFLFSGKVFTLTQGELIFTESPSPTAYISLVGTCDLPEVTVIANLRGPLTSPKLTFQSSPQMPTSSILSQILFNKDISEIEAIQALQLAQTVISLSGNNAPDILEKIRKTLGVDRLTLVTSENDPGKLSLQIGKYLMRGVLLTLSQGAESRNVTVEVDLKKGVKLQAEMNEDQQGKFSLKWHHHY